MSAAGRRGSVKQATNGTWYFVVDLSDPGMPRRQTRRRGFASRRAAQAALTKVLRDLDQRTYVAPVRQTPAGFLVEEWLPAIRTTVRQSTYDSYARNVRLHVAQRWIGAVPLQQVDASKLNRLYADLLVGQQGRRPLAPRSVTYVHVILHRAFRDTIRWDRLVRNPCESADPPKVTKRHRSMLRTWTVEELAAFLASTAGDRLAAVWWLLATTGMRRGEV